MDYIRCYQKLTPIRIAFLISANSNDDSFAQAVRYSTSLWGGKGNVLVPIWNKNSKKQIKQRSFGLVKDFDPDYIVNLTSKPIPNEIVSQYGKRVINHNKFLFRKGKAFRFEIGLTIIPLIQHVWNTEVQMVKGKTRAVFLKDIEKKNYKNYWLSVFGDYPIGTNISKSFIRGLKANELEATFSNLKKLNINEIISPIDFSVYLLNKFGRSGRFSSHIIYFGNPSSKLDAIEYWNMRASGCKILFVPITHFAQFGDEVVDIAKEGNYPINERVQNSASLQKGPSVGESEFRTFCDWIKTEKNINLFSRNGLPKWGAEIKTMHSDVEPCTYIDSERTSNLLFDGDKLSPLELLKPSFFKDDRLYENFKSQRQDKVVWINKIGLDDVRGNDYFLKLPQDNMLSGLITRSYVLGAREKIRLTNSDIAYYNNDFLGNINIYPVTVEETIEEMFRKRGMELKDSPPGLFASRMMEHMGGLHGCRVFKIRGIREALIELSNKGKKRQKKKSSEVKKLKYGLVYSELKNIVSRKTKDEFGGPNWDDHLYKDLVLYYLQPRPLTPEIAIDYLFEKNVFRVGLKLHCKKCGKKDWYHLTEFDVNFVCRYCFEKQHIGSLDGAGGKRWHYKPDGIFMIRNAGEGSLSVILALWRLDHLVSSNNFKFVTSKEVIGIADAEIDFIGIYNDHFQMGTVLILGEARNYVDFSSKNVSKLMEIGARFEKKPYLCFVTLKDKFSDQEIEQLKRVLRKGFGLIPLTRLDLDPYDMYDRFSSLRDQYAVTIEDFSNNLCSLNLNLNEQEVYELSHYKETQLYKKWEKQRELSKEQVNKKRNKKTTKKR